MIKLAVSGACGRMGSRIIALIKHDKDLCLKLALEQKAHPRLNSKIEDVTVTCDDSLISTVDCVIEFSQPEASLNHLERCLIYKRPMVIGTTGFEEQQVKRIVEASKEIPIVFSPNMSVGVNVVFKVIGDMARLLKDYQTRIIEAHHIYKKDAPSGTAKRIASIIEKASSKRVDEIKSIREGEIVGEHEIIFDSPFDTISIKHSAKSRDIFAAGALIAAKWVIHKKSGLYDMGDCLARIY